MQSFLCSIFGIEYRKPGGCDCCAPLNFLFATALSLHAPLRVQLIGYGAAFIPPVPGRHRSSSFHFDSTIVCGCSVDG